MFNFGFWTTVSQERFLHIDLRLITDSFLNNFLKERNFDSTLPMSSALIQISGLLINYCNLRLKFISVC